MHWLYTTFFTCTTGLAIALAVPGENLRVSAPSVVSNNTLRKRAQLITVKVFSGDSIGSGILIERQGSVYTVLTNEHVLDEGDKYSIQTADGRVHPATWYAKTSFNGNDLGILQFRTATVSYPVATLGSSSRLAIGDRVFAAGFPVEADADIDAGFVFRVGQVSLVTDKALDGGYKLGYTNKIEKGMSGGPVLNRTGDVVAINGMHAYPVWGDPYRYKDGSKPCPAMREFMVRSAWAIPIETFLHLYKGKGDANTFSPSTPPSPNMASSQHDVPSSQMQQQAEAAKNCTPDRVPHS